MQARWDRDDMQRITTKSKESHKPIWITLVLAVFFLQYRGLGNLSSQLEIEWIRMQQGIRSGAFSRCSLLYQVFFQHIWWSYLIHALWYTNLFIVHCCTYMAIEIKYQDFIISQGIKLQNWHFTIQGYSNAFNFVSSWPIFKFVFCNMLPYHSTTVINQKIVMLIQFNMELYRKTLKKVTSPSMDVSKYFLIRSKTHL